MANVKGAMIQLVSNHVMNPPSKQQLRTALRRTRRQLTVDEQALSAEQLMIQLSKQFAFSKADTMAVYLSADGELDLGPTIQWLWQQGVSLVLPIVQGKDRPLLFARYSPNEPLHCNGFGIAEPLQKDYVAVQQVTHVLMPLVGFDRRGYRLGMGGGFYDRTFAIDAKQSRPHLIGIAHECQRVEEVPTDPWDIPLDCIVTSLRCYMPDEQS